MAFGGVDTGSMKASEVQRAMTTQTGMGLKPIDTAVAMAIGPMRLATAVLEVSSERNRAVTENSVRKTISEGLPPNILVSDSPIHCDRPVENTIPPIARPPPKRSSVPHSIPLTPSFHSKVILPLLVSTGKTNSNRPPIMAAIASGKYLL